MVGAGVNPDILRWARERMHLSLEDAAARANIGRKKELEPPARLDAMELGNEPVTPNQLKALANLYRRPTLTFYLAKPPAIDNAIPDFRTLADAPVGDIAPNLDVLIRRLRARQQQLRELMIDEGAARLNFIGRFDRNTSADRIAEDIRGAIELPLDEQRRFADRDALFRGLRKKFEALGIFIQLVGDLGSHHSKIEPEVFRGLVLLDDYAPIVAINPNDAAAAFLFTMLHEVAHIWLGEAGISNASAFESGVAANATEQLCNSVAAEFLVPRAPFLESWNANRGQELARKVDMLSASWKVSRAMIARRARELRLISEDDWWGLYRLYQQAWRRQREQLQEQDGGPGWYLLAHRRLGNGLISKVLGALDSGSLTYTEASRILGVKAKNFDGLRERLT